jgi:hypothetical protein
VLENLQSKGEDITQFQPEMIKLIVKLSILSHLRNEYLLAGQRKRNNKKILKVQNTGPK